MYPICSCILPANILLAAPETKFSCVGTVSAAGMVHEVNHPELHQKMSDLLTARVMGLDVGIMVP